MIPHIPKYIICILSIISIGCLKINTFIIIRISPLDCSLNAQSGCLMGFLWTVYKKKRTEVE